jgi:formate/nitrite transporter FocA (FNT family)
MNNFISFILGNVSGALLAGLLYIVHTKTDFWK